MPVINRQPLLVAPDRSLSPETMPKSAIGSDVCSVRTRGTLYCYKLMDYGVPFSEACHIAAAIAKYDARGKIPTEAQKTLIMQFSANICRAHLWRPRLLLSTKL